MSISKEEFNKAEQEAQQQAAAAAAAATATSAQKNTQEQADEEESIEAQEPSTRSSEDTHQFHSPLNSNAIITITTDEPIDIQPLLQNHETFELLPSSPPYIKIKFIDKTQAQLLQSEILERYPNLDIQIEFDALTHPGNIYVRGLVPEITTQDLYKIFEPFGEITSLKIVQDEFGRSKGYGFINFLEGTSAEEAIIKLNGLLVNGSKLYLNHHIAKKERIERMDFEKSNFTNLYIKNLPIDYNLDQFNELFLKFGEINSTFLPELPEHEISSPSSTAKRFGFVNFKNHESAIAAIEELDNKEISSNHFLSVSRAQRRDERHDHTYHHHINPLRNNSISPTPAPLLFQSPSITANPIPTSLPALISSPPPQQIPTMPIPTPHATPVTNSTTSAPTTTTTTTTTPIIQLPVPGPNHQQSNLYVKNLSPNIDDSALHSAFAPFGIIVSAKIMTTEDGSSRGFGFVCYRTSPEASRALLAMNGGVLDGNVLHVSFAQKNSRRKFQQRVGPPGIPGGVQGPVPLDYPVYYNQYQETPAAAYPLYYTGNSAASGPGGAVQNGNNGYIPFNMMRSYNNGNSGNGYNKYYRNSYSAGNNNNYVNNGGNSSSGYNDKNISEYSKKIGKLTSEISSIQDDDLKIEKISKILIIPKLLKNGESEDVEARAKSFLKSQVESYNKDSDATEGGGGDIYLDIINDWANDEDSLVKELEKLTVNHDQ